MNNREKQPEPLWVTSNLSEAQVAAVAKARAAMPPEFRRALEKIHPAIQRELIRSYLATNGEYRNRFVKRYGREPVGDEAELYAKEEWRKREEERKERERIAREIRERAEEEAAARARGPKRIHPMGGFYR